MPHHRQRNALRGTVLFLCALLASTNIRAENSLTLEVLGEEFSLQQFPAANEKTSHQLVLYVAPGYGFNVRGTNTAQALSKLGIEVWMVDLAENLFLPISNETTHSIDGRYLANIIEQAYKRTGKNITLLSSSFGAIPTLRGAREWQLGNPQQAYVNGAILFSPEMYRSIPALGVDPDFEPITSATNIPLMIFQSELRNNRWQLENVVQRLQKGGAVVYQKILPNIVSFFYQIDELPDTVRTLRELPNEIPRVIKLLQSTATPLVAADLPKLSAVKKIGPAIKLRKYQGNRQPGALDLENINGKQIVRTHFKNKVTVVNFWATWCPPCVEEIPMLNRLRAKMSGHNFELLSINFGQQKAVIEKFLKKVNVEFPVLLDEGGRVAGAWNTIVLPSTFVIGPDGKFAYAVNAAIEWDSPEVVAALKQLAGD
jgi:thiol-disulfide isomerase/thioredoxin